MQTERAELFYFRLCCVPVIKLEDKYSMTLKGVHCRPDVGGVSFCASGSVQVSRKD